MSRCLHCDKEEANYCETCYQALISENAKLQKEINIKSKKENVDNEYEKMIIDIPKKAKAVSVVTIAELGCQLVMNTHTYDTQDIVKRKLEKETFE